MIENLTDLTPALQAVGELLSQGLSNSEIAAKRAVTEQTVANQIHEIGTLIGNTRRVYIAIWVWKQINVEDQYKDPERIIAESQEAALNRLARALRSCNRAGLPWGFMPMYGTDREGVYLFIQVDQLRARLALSGNGKELPVNTINGPGSA